MGQRGPKPKPTALRILHGDRKDRINFDEPVAAEGVPECPDGASAEVRAVWDYTVDQLARMRTASPADRDALLCYCEAVVQHRHASAILAKSAVLIRRSEADGFIRNPAVQVQRDAAVLIGRFAGLFGLSPASRSEIRNPKNTTSHGSADRYLTG